MDLNGKNLCLSFVQIEKNSGQAIRGNIKISPTSIFLQGDFNSVITSRFHVR